MPPHCDSMDGPVVAAATRALEAGDVRLVLPYVPEAAEPEVTEAFAKVLRMRDRGPEAREVGDRYLFETVVRLHRAGEGAPFTGLRPAGLGHGPVVPVAERAIETGSARELVRLLTATVEAEVQARFERVMRLKARAGLGVAETRAYVEAMLGLQVYAHGLHACATAEAHGAHGERAAHRGHEA